MGKSPIGFIDGVAPKYLSHGKGSHVWDVDGNEYIDCWLACLPITFGYCNKDINKAIKKQLNKGITFSMMHQLEVEVAERLINDIPIAEQVRYTKNGSDACAASVKIARHITGKDKVVTLGYHGFHDWYISSTDRSYGVPQCVKDLTLRTKYNNPDHLQSLFDSNKDQIACVILEPVIFEEPSNNYLQKVKDICHSNGGPSHL